MILHCLVVQVVKRPICNFEDSPHNISAFFITWLFWLLLLEVTITVLQFWVKWSVRKTNLLLIYIVGPLVDPKINKLESESRYRAEIDKDYVMVNMYVIRKPDSHTTIINVTFIQILISGITIQMIMKISQQ